MHNMQVYERVFTWPSNGPQGLEFRYYSWVDFSIAIWDKDAHWYWLPVIIRWLCWWGFMWDHNDVVLKLMNLITQEKEFKRECQFQKLKPNIPIVLFHEHQELVRDWSTRMIFEKIKINSFYGIRVRVLHRMEHIFYDFRISVFNPNQVLQRWLFDVDTENTKETQYIWSPVFVSDAELDEISDFLSTVLVVQKKHYQSVVDELLKQLPSIKEEFLSN